MNDIIALPSSAIEKRIWLRSLKSIAVFRALQLGDLLCSVPALRALRAAAPQAKITLISLPWASEFAQRFDAYVDDFIAFPGFPGLPESTPTLHQIAPFLIDVQARQFDLAIQLHGSGTLTNPLMMAFGAKQNAGFYPLNGFNPDPDRFLAWPDQEHEVLRYLDLMEFIGAETQGDALEFPVTNADRSNLRSAAPNLPLPGSYVCIHPGARLPSRRWLPESFAEVADRLHALGWNIVITGSEGEREITSLVVDAMHAPALDLTGRTDLGSLAALIANAAVVICNDTGISHVTTAVATPSVVICSGALAHRWAPLNRLRHRVIAADVDCRPCMHYACPIGHPCARNVSADMVLVTVDDLLDTLTTTAAQMIAAQLLVAPLAINNIDSRIRNRRQVAR